MSVVTYHHAAARARVRVLPTGRLGRVVFVPGGPTARRGRRGGVKVRVELDTGKFLSVDPSRIELVP